MKINKAQVYRLLATIIFISSFCVTVQSQKFLYPQAKRVEHTDTYHGVQVTDPYRWMEEAESNELKAWIKSQDELLKGFVDKSALRTAIKNRMSELVTYDSYTNATGFISPYVAKRGTRYFFIKTISGKNEPVLYIQESLDSKPRVLLDVAAKYKNENLSLEGYDPSPDGKYIALYLSQSGDRWLMVKIISADTGKETSDVLKDTHRIGGSVSWTPDGKAFFYVKFSKIQSKSGQPNTVGSRAIYFHKLGNSQSNDTMIYETQNQKILFSHQVTSDGKYLVINSVEGSSPQSRVLYKELNGNNQVKPLFDKADASYIFLGSKDSLFWFYTNLNAPRGRVISVDITKHEKLNEIIPESKDVISGSSSVGGNALGMFGNKILLLYMRDSNPIIKAFNVNGKLEDEIMLPSGGTVWGGFSGTQTDDEVFYQYLGLTSPGLFYKLDMSSKQNKVFLRPEVNLNPDNYVTKQVFFQSKDGTRVPMFIAHRKEIKLDGNNPAFMYGYGAMNWVAFIWYQPHILAWLDMGGIYAVPGIRGGGEYGEEWHQAGVKQNKQNSIDDYIAAAEWLIKNKYTSPSQLAANGGSASSAVAAGAAILQRAELFGAAVIDIPILDMLRYHQFTNGRYWIPEFGSADDHKEFKTLFSYSPYHNIKQDKCYPPTLIMVGEKDQTALPLHGFKFTARMQHAQGCDNPVFLKMMWGAGHNFGKTPEQRIDSWTDELAFLVEVLKVKHAPTN